MKLKIFRNGERSLLLIIPEDSILNQRRCKGMKFRSLSSCHGQAYGETVVYICLPALHHTQLLLQRIYLKIFVIRLFEEVKKNVLYEDDDSLCFCCFSLNNIAMTPNLLKYDMVPFHESCCAIPILIKIGQK